MKHSLTNVFLFLVLALLCACSDGSIASKAIANVLPTADAGPDQSVSTGSLVTLDGSNSSDANADPLTYSWVLISVPNGSAAELSDTNSVAPKFTVDLDGEYIAALTVNDGKESSNPDTVTVTASTANSAPVADAGSDQNIKTGTQVSLDGSNSSDVDGDLLTYFWSLMSKPEGSQAQLDDPESVAPSFTADLDGDYIVSLTVSDGKTQSAPDSVLVNATTSANSAPIADAGGNQSVTTGSQVTLDGSGSSDADGDPLAYSWAFVSKPEGSQASLSDPSSVSPSFAADAAGFYTVRLVVNDGMSDSAPDTVVIRASSTTNSPPVADAGENQTVTTGTQVTLDGSGSSDANGDPLTYSWAFISKPNGSAASLSDFTSVAPSFVADLDGFYVLRLVVGDGTDKSPPDTVTIRAVKNRTPVAEAGDTQTVTAGSQVTLDGSGSSDADGDPLTYKWEFVQTPPESNATLSDSESVAPRFQADKVGVYIVKLVVKDGTDESAPDTVTIRATPSNTAPVAEAGPNQNVSTGSRVTLDGSGSSDANGDPLSYKWEFVQKPHGSNAVLSDDTLIAPTFQADMDGVYIVKLVVDDGKTKSNPDAVTISSTP